MRFLLCAAALCCFPCLAWGHPTVRVYADTGASRDSVQHTLRALRSALSAAYAVTEMDANTLLNSAWESDTALLVLPGGRDLPYVEKLGDRGAARIRNFVQAGGAYLGLCAGGYFGAARIDFFADNRALAISGERPLKFYAGRCVGPVWQDFAYNSETGAHAARVQPEAALAARTGDTFVLYQNGGGAFVAAEDHPNTRVLLRYAEGPSREAAAILCEVGAGRAVLTGVHPEYDAAGLSLHTPTAVREALLSAAPQRCEAWAYLLQQLGLAAACSAPAVVHAR